MTPAQRSGYFNLAVDLLKARWGTVPHPYFSTVPLGELTMTAPCAHEDLIAFCPHGCPEGTYDSDTNVCSSCHEPVCPTWNCAYCDEQIGEGFERPKTETVAEPCERTIPPHFRSTILTDTGEVCVECGGEGRIQHNEPDHPITAPTYTDCPKCSTPDLTHESSSDWIRRMAHS